MTKTQQTAKVPTAAIATVRAAESLEAVLEKLLAELSASAGDGRCAGSQVRGGTDE